MYVGITSRDVKKRWGNNGCNYCGNKHFYSAIKKYGWNNFIHKTLSTNLTIEEASEQEIFLINYFDLTNCNFGYNISSGGECSASGIVLSSEVRMKISNKLKGRILSDEHKNKISISQIGKRKRPLTEERKYEISCLMKGSNNPRAKKVLCETTNEIFGCITEAAQAEHVSRKVMTTHIKNHTPVNSKYYITIDEH